MICVSVEMLRADTENNFLKACRKRLNVAKKLFLLPSLGESCRRKAAGGNPHCCGSHAHTCCMCKSLLSRAGWVFIVVVFPRFLVLGFASGGHPVEPADSCPLSYRPDLGISHDRLTILDTDHSNLKLPFSLLLPPFQSCLVS